MMSFHSKKIIIFHNHIYFFQIFNFIGLKFMLLFYFLTK